MLIRESTTDERSAARLGPPDFRQTANQRPDSTPLRERSMSYLAMSHSVIAGRHRGYAINSPNRDLPL